MKKIILTFGLLSGAVMSIMMLLTMWLLPNIGFDKGEVVGYTSMVLAFLFVFFGVRRYRERRGEEGIGFWRAFGVGMAITVIASICYVVTWEIGYSRFFPDFPDKWAAYEMDQARKSGATDADLLKKKQEMAQFMETYKNPVYNSAMTFMEPLPVGLIMSLVTAGILRRRKKQRTLTDPPVAATI